MGEEFLIHLLGNKYIIEKKNQGIQKLYISSHPVLHPPNSQPS